MERIIIPAALLIFIGLTLLIVKASKASIRRAIEAKGCELMDISTTYDFLWRTFRYEVTFKTKEGRVATERCRVSLFLGVVWADEDSFLKWLLP